MFLGLNVEKYVLFVVEYFTYFPVKSVAVVPVHFVNFAIFTNVHDKCTKESLCYRTRT